MVTVAMGTARLLPCRAAENAAEPALAPPGGHVQGVGGVGVRRGAIQCPLLHVHRCCLFLPDSASV